MVQRRMRNRLLWVSKALLLWLTAMLAGPWLTGLASGLLYWMAARSGATVHSRAVFTGQNYLRVLLLCGVLLGLLPLSRLVEWGRAALGIFRPASVSDTAELTTGSSPLLWGWALPFALFLVRFAAIDTGRVHSVLAGNTAPQFSRLTYFFGSAWSDLLPHGLMPWMIDRLMIVTPMLFLLGFAGGILVRRILLRHAGSARQEAVAD